MKILFFLEYYYPNVGGIEKLFKELAEALVVKGHEVMVLTNKFDTSLKSEETINGVKIKRLKLKNRFLFSFLSIASVLKYGRNFDLIHTTSYNAALPASIAGKILGKKVIITFHEVWGKMWFKLPFLNLAQKNLFYLYEKLILSLTYHTFVAVSDSTKLALIEHGISAQKIIRIYNGIDYQVQHKENKKLPKNFTFTFLGRLGVSKGLDLLIPAAARFIKTHPKAIFQIISPDKPNGLKQKIDGLIIMHHLRKNINWLKNIDSNQIKKRLQASHCLIIPSYSEGFCFVAAEAVALGVPIISSNKAALKEVVSGKFIKLKDLNSDEIYNALLLAKNGKFEENEIKKFPFSVCLNAYLKLYLSIKN